MKNLIIGAGKMGIRHAQGVKSLAETTAVTMADISKDALENAMKAIDDSRFSYKLINELKDEEFDFCIIAATASGRNELLQLARQVKSKHILVEKPLGQSMQQVLDLKQYVDENALNCYVNLNMRLYESFIILKNDLQKIPQLQGNKTITINTGTLGIGANGIHYLDLFYFILNANSAELVAAEIDDALIPSGRGAAFGDFGGWAVIKFYRDKVYQGKVLLSMASDSTVFGSWEIVAPNGRIYFNEVEGKRVDTFRKEDSQLPVNRYFGDYLPPVESNISSPFLGDLTAIWIKGLLEGKSLLPKIDESIKVHELLFAWLAKSNQYKKKFPIT